MTTPARQMLWVVFVIASCSAAVPPVTLDLFVASKCPDASRCENTFLPTVLHAVGDLLDVRLGFIGTVNESAPFGVECMHGDDECAGNIVQLCAQRHFPTDVGVDTGGLGKSHSWTRLLDCVGHFNHTNESAIPHNTDTCLATLGVPEAVLARVHTCARGAEGRALLRTSVELAADVCGPHSAAPHVGCKSCSMYLDGARACVVDDGEWYNCSAGLSPTETSGQTEQETATAWIREVCLRAVSAPSALQGIAIPLVCRLLMYPTPAPAPAPLSMPAPTLAPASGQAARPVLDWRSGLPVIAGHSYASVDPLESARFAVKYFGAVIEDHHTCVDDTDATEVVVRLPSFPDYRGGGMELRFVSNVRKPAGGYNISSFVRSMRTLYGNLSDNSGHHWNQYFDSHLGFYVTGMDELARRLISDAVPFFTGVSSGLYESVYVEIPGTGKVVEVLGDFDAGGSAGEPLPSNHVRISSTQQFCTPKRLRRRRRLLQRSEGSGSKVGMNIDFGTQYIAGDADTNKTTMAAADPDAAVDFAVRYLGASRIQQHRSALADGQCAKLAWAQWPDGHQWHVVRTDAADWVTKDHLSPAVPFNISQLAAHVEALRNLSGGVYDQWLDFRDIFQVSNLTPVAAALRADGVPFILRSRPATLKAASNSIDLAATVARSCSLLCNLPGNGLAVEIRSTSFHGLDGACAQPFDLCARS